MNCSQRGFRVLCGDEGQLEYDDDGLASSSLRAADQTCVPIECSMSSVDDSNGVRYPLTSTVLHGQMVTVTCNAGYRVSPEGFTGEFALCHHASNFSVACDNRSVSQERGSSQREGIENEVYYI